MGFSCFCPLTVDLKDLCHVSFALSAVYGCALMCHPLDIYFFSGFNGFMPFSVTSASQCLSNLPLGSEGKI